MIISSFKHNKITVDQGCWVSFNITFKKSETLLVVAKIDSRNFDKYKQPVMNKPSRYEVSVN